ncbi:MAG: Flp pilus assembly protein CpaB [Myxococcota bacterium]|nr:Flp pilus assembly protein CpaB [Myxococcota bacterium]
MQQRQQTGGRGRAYIFLGVSVVAAALAVFLVVQLLRRAENQLAEASKPQETVDVVVAARNLYMGLPIGEDDVAVVKLVPEIVPADVTFTSKDAVMGRIPKERVLAQEILRAERLARAESGVGLNALITPGKRAVSIAVKAEEAVAGFIQPLNYVDVIVVIKPDDKEAVNSRAVSKILLQGIKVLAIGDSMQGNYGDETEKGDAKGKKATTKKKQQSKSAGVVKGKRTVTLEVTPEEAEQIALAQAKGDIVLALRADIDINQITTNGKRVDSLIGLDDPEAAPPSPIKPRTGGRTSRPTKPTTEAPAVGAEVIQGDDKTDYTVGEDGRVIEEGRRGRR